MHLHFIWAIYFQESFQRYTCKTMKRCMHKAIYCSTISDSKRRKQPKYLSQGDGLNKLRCVHKWSTCSYVKEWGGLSSGCYPTAMWSPGYTDSTYNIPLFFQEWRRIHTHRHMCIHICIRLYLKIGRRSHNIFKFRLLGGKK